MKIEAKISKINVSDKVKAEADVTLDDAITIHQVKLVENDKGRFILFPRREWQDKNGKFQHSDIVHPTNADTRSALFKAVQDAFTNFVQTAGQAQTGIAM